MGKKQVVVPPVGAGFIVATRPGAEGLGMEEAWGLGLLPDPQPSPGLLPPTTPAQGSFYEID